MSMKWLAQLILWAWLELKLPWVTVIILCRITICSADISSCAIRHPGDRAILWAWAVILDGTLNSMLGGKAELPFREIVPGDEPHWKQAAHSRRPCLCVLWAYPRLCSELLPWVSCFFPRASASFIVNRENSKHGGLGRGSSCNVKCMWFIWPSIWDVVGSPQFNFSPSPGPATQPNLGIPRVLMDPCKVDWVPWVFSPKAKSTASPHYLCCCWSPGTQPSLSWLEVNCSVCQLCKQVNHFQLASNE